LSRYVYLRPASENLFITLLLLRSGGPQDVPRARCFFRYLRNPLQWLQQSLRAGSAYRIRSAVLEVLESRQHLDATLTPTADTFVRDGSYATTNYGTWQQIQAKQGATDLQRQVYAKYNILGVSGTISQAKLRLHGRRSNTNDAAFSISVKGVADTSWGETAVTWNNKPAIGSTLGTAGVTSTTAGWIEVDVTSYLQQAQSANANAVSLAVVGAAASDAYFEMSSRKPRPTGPSWS
jgi:hypothetical protein